MNTNQALFQKFLTGDRRALAKLISSVEDLEPGSEETLHLAYPRLGKAHRIGVTGPPGVGKSTLVNGLILSFRQAGLKVGVIAVDPTSPFTGGAFLGDRLRMRDASLDPQVFIRSLATRGSSGGLSRATRDVADLLDAFGKDVILIETVGVGQSELDIVGASDTTVVVLVPESGDSIQAMKAGLMEIGDLFCINKADREGAAATAAAIEFILQLKQDAWRPKVLKTVATRAEGITELVDELRRHREHLEERDLLGLRRRERIRSEIKEIVEERIREELWSDRDESLPRLVQRVMDGELTPWSAAEEVLRDQGGESGLSRWKWHQEDG